MITKEIALRNKLENIHCAYFCTDSSCPNCQGFYEEISRRWGKEKLKLELTEEKKKARVGEIWSLAINGNYPIYILLLERLNNHFRAVRASDFIDFKSSYDLVLDNCWLLECWNTFPVRRERLQTKITEVSLEKLEEVKRLVKECEITEKDNIPDIITRFRQIELNYQNQQFLEEDEEKFMEELECSG